MAAGFIPQSDFTAAGFANAVNDDHLPWIARNWSDSMIEQYFNMLNSEQANEHEIEMWRLNNEYNTPAAQMQRMIEAGINPAAAYSQVTSGNASSGPGTHKIDSVKWHDTTDKLAKQKLVLESVNDFVKTFGDLLNNAFAIPEQVSRNRSSSYQANMLYNEWSQKDLAHSLVYRKGTPEYERAVQSGTDPVHLGGDYYMAPYIHPNPYNIEYFEKLQDLLQRQDTQKWLVEQRNHLKTMFEDEESRVAADASMRQWLEQYKSTIPPEYRYFLDILLQLLQIGAPRGSYHLGVSKSQKVQ